MDEKTEIGEIIGFNRSAVSKILKKHLNNGNT
jgi:hypothetical protein